MRRLNLRWAKNITGGLAGFVTVFAVLATAASAPAQDAGPAANVAEALRAGTPRIAEQLANTALHGQSLTPLVRAHILMNRGLAREQIGVHRAALGDFNIALAMNVLQGDDLARAYFDRGVTRDELGETGKAIADYSAALKLVPQLSAALNNRANAYRRLGRLAEAKQGYLASLKAGNPAPQYPWYGLGQIAEAQGKPADAANWYAKAVKADGDYALAAQRLAALQGPGGVTQATFVLHPPKLASSGTRPAKSQATSLAKSEVKSVADEVTAPVRAQMASYSPVAATTVPALRPAILGLRGTIGTGRGSKGRADLGAAGSAMVQLGAWRDQGDAADGWNHVAGAAGEILQGRTPQIIAANIPGKGRYYRLRVNVADWHRANALCAQLKARDLACLAVRG